VVGGGKLLRVLYRLLLYLYLRGHRRDAPLTNGGDFRWRRPTSDAARPVIADTINRRVVDGDVVDHDRVRYRAVIDLHIGDRDVVHRAVVIEATTIPIAALISNADISEAIVDPAVISDIRGPIAVTIAVHAADKAPISRRPEIAHLRGLYPCPGHPVVTLRGVTPISRGPEIAVTGAVRLRIIRQRWGRLLRLKHGLTVA
jgi:hypothetical protein